MESDIDKKTEERKPIKEILIPKPKINNDTNSILSTNQKKSIHDIYNDKDELEKYLQETAPEFYEKFEDSNLTPIFKHEASSMCITSDARHLWRVIENLLNNVCKYALSGTRVYMDMKYVPGKDDRNNVEFSIKNISSTELNIDVAELTERFIRGDVSRATEGSGLGLSIAKNLTIAQGGTFDIKLDGDLFKVVISFEAV